MNKGTKFILSILGVAAIVVPAVLLIVLTKNAPKTPEISSAPRTIDKKTVEDAVKKIPSPSPIFLPSPSPASSSASPIPSGN